MTPQLILYFSPGSCARVPMIALEETGARFEARLVAFMAGEHRSPEYLSLNPAGKVPLLVVNGTPIAQNSAILPLLARLFPASHLLPTTHDPLTDAQLQARLNWFSGDVHPLVTRIRMPHFFCDLPGGPERVRTLGASAMAAQLSPVEAALSAAPWLLGDAWSLLDAYLFWVWFRITGAGFDTTPFPNIVAHYDRMSDRPSTKRALVREAAAEAELLRRGLTVPAPGER